MPETVKLTNAVLGLNPFILIEMTGVDGDDIDVKMRFGGGTKDPADVVAVLYLALDQMRDNGLAPETFARIDADTRARFAEEGDPDA